MKIVGITGKSGAGKTTISNLIKEKYDAEIVDADEVAKELSQKGTMYLKSIVDYFGDDIIKKDGQLNRKKLANLIFNDDDKREELNHLTSLYVVKEIKRRISKINHKQMILVDAPLLYESGLDQICDIVIGITSSQKEKIERIMQRDNISEEEAKRRLKVQITNQFLEENADIIINNSQDIEELKKQVEKMKI